MIDTYRENTSEGELKITPIFHGSVRMRFKGKEIHIDPWSKGDYSSFSHADLILITHPHGDHLDPELVRKLADSETKIIVNHSSEKSLEDLNPIVMANGDSAEIFGIKINAIPAYNIVRERSPGVKYHPKGEGNGYILTMGDKRIYIPGDTEATPEIEQLKGIDISFIPIRLPYTMSPEEAALVVTKFKPKIVIPYHTGGEPVPKIFLDMLASHSDIEVRVVQSLQE